MLEQLVVKNVGVIEAAKLSFKKGFVCITGETGAGKSLLLGAVELIQGNSPERITLLKESAKNQGKVIEVEAIFSKFNQEVKAQLDDSSAFYDSELIINRELDSNNNRFRSSVGAKTVPVQVLQNLGENLVSIHGQNEHLKLKNQSTALNLLDKVSDIDSELKVYKQKFSEFQIQLAELNQLNSLQNEAEKQKDYLNFAISKIEAVDPKLDELELLNSQLESAKSKAFLAENLNIIQNSVQNLENIYSASDSAKKLAVKFDEFNELNEMIETVKINLDEIRQITSSKIFEIQSNSLNLETLNSRIKKINSLNSFGNSTSEILEFLENAKTTLSSLDDSKLRKLEDEIVLQKAKLLKLAEVISSKRFVAKEEFESQINLELESLGFDSAKIRIDLNKLDEPNSSGIDKVDFLFSPHSSVDFAGLNKIASGGELSRIMLAIELVIVKLVNKSSKTSSEEEVYETLIFDEVDAGIGGEVAIKVGEKLKLTANLNQVICVTHLASVAAKADQHFKLVKSEGKTEIIEVVDDARVEEIARLLSGEKNEDSLNHAKRLLGNNE